MTKSCLQYLSSLPPERKVFLIPLLISALGCYCRSYSYRHKSQIINKCFNYIITKLGIMHPFSGLSKSHFCSWPWCFQHPISLLGGKKSVTVIWGVYFQVIFKVTWNFPSMSTKPSWLALGLYHRIIIYLAILPSIMSASCSN